MLMRVYVTLDQEHRIVLPAGIRKVLGLEPGNKVALTMVGMNAARKALLSKPRERKIHEKTYSRPRR
jgi:AbrB family looped-hinge helix DNA binding protein